MNSDQLKDIAGQIDDFRDAMVAWANSCKERRKEHRSRDLPKRYSVNCAIVELGLNGEIVEGGHNGDLEFELLTEGSPATVLMKALSSSDLQANMFCVSDIIWDPVEQTTTIRRLEVPE